MGGQQRAGSARYHLRGRHLIIDGNGSLVLSAEKVNRFRPSADVLFESMANMLAHRAISVVLSGLLSDGARGTAAIRARGGLAMAQDKDTATFFDMPSAAIDYGKAEVVLSPRRLGFALGAMMDL